MKIEIAFATEQGAQRETLDLAPGATVADALAASRLAARTSFAAAAVFGEVAAPQRALAPDDRIDLLREMAADPMDMRRRRAASSISSASA